MPKKHRYKADKPNYLTDHPSTPIQLLEPVFRILRTRINHPKKLTIIEMLLIFLVFSRCLAEGQKISVNITSSNNVSTSSNHSLSTKTNGTQVVTSLGSEYNGVPRLNLAESYIPPSNKVNTSNDNSSKPKARVVHPREHAAGEKLMQFIIELEPDLSVAEKALDVFKRDMTTTDFLLIPHLRLATIFKQENLVDLLLTYGVNVNGIATELFDKEYLPRLEKTKAKVKPLLVAACYYRVEIVEKLIAKGARAANLDPSVRLSQDEIYGPKSHTVQMAAAHGIPTEKFYDFTPLHIAAYFDPDSIEPLVLRGDDINAYVDPIGTPLHAAVKSTAKAIETLVRLGANINAVDSMSMTPLHLAVRPGDTNNLRLLLNLGADPYAYDHDNYTPIHRAVESPESLSILLAHGVDPNVETRNTQFTPLVIAIYLEQHQSLKKLLQAGADPNRSGKQGLTALHRAAQHLPEVIPALIKHGANLESKDDNGATPITYAVIANNAAAVRKLLKFNPIVDREAIKKLSNYNSNTIIRELIDSYVEQHNTYSSSISPSTLLLILASNFAIVLLPFLLAYKFAKEMQNRLAKQHLQNKDIECLNSITDRFYTYPWQIQNEKGYSLELATKEQPFITKEEIQELTLSILKRIDQDVVIKNNQLIISRLNEQNFSAQKLAENLASEIAKRSPEEELITLEELLAVTQQSYRESYTSHRLKLKECQNDFKELAANKMLLQNCPNVTERSLAKLIKDAVISCDESSKSFSILVKLSPTAPNKGFKTELNSIAHKVAYLRNLITLQKITNKTAQECFHSIRESIDKFNESIRRSSHDILNAHKTCRSQLDKINDCKKTLIERGKLSNETKSTPEAAILPTPSVTAENLSSDLVELMPEEEPTPLEEPVLLESIELTPTSKKEDDSKPDTRHLMYEAIELQPARKITNIPMRELGFFASNVIPKQKDKEQPGADPETNLNTAEQEAFNFSEALGRLSQNQKLEPIDRLIALNDVCYHLLRFSYSLWHFTLVAMPDLAPKVSQIRQQLVHKLALILLNDEPRTYEVLWRSGIQFKEQFSESFLQIKNAKQFNPDHLRHLIESFSLSNLGIFQIPEIGLDLNLIINNLMSAMEAIKNIGKVFQHARQLRSHLDRAAAIKMLIVNIGEYAYILKERYLLEKQVIKQLLPTILWQETRHGKESIKSVLSICLAMRNDICHYTQKLADGRYRDVDEESLFRLISSLSDSKLSLPTIQLKKAQREQLIAFLIQNRANRQVCEDLSSDILNYFLETNRIIFRDEFDQHIAMLKELNPSSIEAKNLRQYLLEACRQPRQIEYYIGRLQAGLKWGEACQGYIDELASERAPLPSSIALMR